MPTLRDWISVRLNQGILASDRAAIRGTVVGFFKSQVAALNKGKDRLGILPFLRGFTREIHDYILII